MHPSINVTPSPFRNIHEIIAGSQAESAYLTSYAGGSSKAWNFFACVSIICTYTASDVSSQLALGDLFTLHRAQFLRVITHSSETVQSELKGASVVTN